MAFEEREANDSCIFNHPELEEPVTLNYGEDVDLWHSRASFMIERSESGLSEIEYDYKNIYIDYYHELFIYESSVGLIFINDIEDLELNANCIIEYNFYDNDGITLRDSSGNENNGILIGDFGVSKVDEESPLGLDSSIKKPLIDQNEDGVF